MTSETCHIDYLALKDEGNALYSAGDFLGAVQKYSKGLKLCADNNTDRTTLLKNRAAAYLNLREYQKVIEDTTAALEITPSDIKALYRRCQAYEQLGKYNEAFEDAKAVNSLNPQNSAIQPYLRRLGEIVSIESAGTMADSCCIAELKKTIEKMNAELTQSHTKISELNAKIKEQEEDLSVAQKEMSKIQEEKAQLARDLKESEEKCRAVQERMEFAEQKLVQFSLVQVNESNDGALGINSLPDEIIEEVFGYFTQNQLGQIARVCRRWNVLTKSPDFWRNVNVKIFASNTEKNAVTKSFIDGLPTCVTFMRLDFEEFDVFRMDFEELCVKLQQNCPILEELILAHCVIPNNLSVVVNFCTQFLLGVKKLAFHNCYFSNRCRTVEINDTSKIEVLDLYACDFFHFGMIQFSKLLYLKKLRIALTIVDDTWFAGDTSFFNRLHVLDLGLTYITASTFPAIQNHGHNLKELYVCNFNLQDHDLTFTGSVFPQLKTICIGYTHVTCEGVVSLIQSCPSLENVYVREHVAESFAAHSFVVANRCKSGIVKVMDGGHNHNVDY